ncbi:hypothetical protein AAFF_G00356030 [Aldrovandia affinis]|uniref:Uncharacterized protein n=1 Tax=Aldrovandia affinis TaxID=143900 RepID=A0AAD7R521_9TELE|nr:hypothetical protein AAFF_G00356030 [Aldrovandia affinis]
MSADIQGLVEVCRDHCTENRGCRGQSAGVGVSVWMNVGCRGQCAGVGSVVEVCRSLSLCDFRRQSEAKERLDAVVTNAPQLLLTERRWGTTGLGPEWK